MRRARLGAAGLDPEKSTIFIQSRLPEHAELFTLLSMGTPLGWLERVPTYKDQIEKLKDRLANPPPGNNGQRPPAAPADALPKQTYTDRTTVSVGVADKVRFEIAVSDEFVEPTIEALCDGGRTGEVGDGKIFVVPVERVVRIRTGEIDVEAVTPIPR